MSFSAPARNSKSSSHRRSPHRHIVRAHPRVSNHGKGFRVPSYVRGKGLPPQPEFKSGSYLTPETEGSEINYCANCDKLGNRKLCHPYGAHCPTLEKNSFEGYDKNVCNRSVYCRGRSTTPKCNADECPLGKHESPEHEEEEQAEAGLREELSEGSHPVVSVRTSAGTGPEADVAAIYADEIEKWSEEHGVHDLSHVSKSEMDFLRKGVSEVKEKAQQRIWSEVSHDELQLLAKRMGFSNAEAALSQSDVWVADYLDCRNEFQGDKK